jgi:hypothetical protein
LSKRPNSRIQRRDERAASQPGNEQRARRQRSAQPAGIGRGGLPMTTILIGLGVLAIVAILVYAVTQADNTDSGPAGWQLAQEDDDPNIPGLYYAPHPGPDGILYSPVPTSDDRLHYAPGTVIPICSQEQIDAGTISDPLCYTSNPPTSGPHSSTPQGFSNLVNPAPKENIVHSMEHGGVFVWYNTTDEDAVDLIKSVVQENDDRRRFVGSTIYTEMEPETIAITSWTRLDKFPVSELTEERLQTFIDENHKRFNPEGF